MRGFLRVALLLLLACGATPAMAGRVALAIGAGAYRHAPPLPNAVNDATDLAATLRELGFRVDLVVELRGQPDRGSVTAPQPAPPRAPAPQIAALPVPRPAEPPPDPNRPMSRAEAQEAQRLLSATGFDAGPADGVIGPRSRAALEAFARAADLPASTDFTLGTLERLRGPAPSAERRRAALAPPPAPPAPAPVVARPPAPAAVPAPSAVPAGPVPFRCPPAGLRLIIADGPPRTLRGTAPDDPEVCLYGNAAQPVRALFNLFGLPLDDERRRREGMRAIFPAAPGRSSNFLSIIPAGGNAATLRDTWQVLRRETLDLGSGPRAPLVFRRERQGEFGNAHLSHETYWWHIATGAWLRRDVGVIRGTGGNRPFLVLRIDGG